MHAPTTRKPAAAKRQRRTVFEAKLSASPSKLLRLQGLADALAEITGDPVPTGHIPLREACHRAAALHPCPAGPLLIEAVRLRHKIVTHRICDHETAIRIAHGVKERRTMSALVRKGLSKAAKRVGLRDARPRPWHKNPETAARLEALVDRFLAAYRPYLIAGQKDDPWAFALVAPHPPKYFENDSGADILAVMNADGTRLELLHLAAADHPLIPFAGREDQVCRAISAALAATERLKPQQVWRLADGHGGLSAAREVAPLKDWPNSGDYGFWRRFSFCWERTHANGLAHFRRLLAPEIQDHAALSGRQFSDPRKTAEFFAARANWSLEDYKRANQAIRTIPILRPVIALPEISGPILAGRPIEEAVRAAVTCDRSDLAIAAPLHQKTIRSLSKSYRLSVTVPPVTVYNFADVVPVVDAIFRANPHTPVLDGTELEQIRALAKFDRTTLDLRIRAALAHRNARGKIRKCPELIDAYSWVYQRAGIVLFGTEDHPSERHLAIASATYDIVFPEGRTLEALTAFNRTWHEEQRWLDTGYTQLRSSLLASRILELKSDADLYPHFLSSETTVDGVKFKPLVREDAILAEGEDLDHCVGRYAGEAAAGRSMLVSQISDHGRSTAEVCLEQETKDGVFSWKLGVVQNKAMSNAEPPAAHVSALAKLLKAIQQDLLPQLSQRIQRASLLADRHRGNVYRVLPPEDVELLRDHAFADLKRYMARGPRKLSRAQWQGLYQSIETDASLQPAESELEGSIPF